MSMTTVVPSASTRLMSSSNLHQHIKPCTTTITINHTLFFNPLSHKDRSLRYLIINGKTAQTDNNSKTDFATYSTNTDIQGDLISFGPLLNSGKAWILGGLLTVILPFLTNKWGPMLKWTKGLEMAEEKIEEMAEAVEKVGEDVEKVAEEIEEKLPDGGKLKSAVTLVENVAKETVNDADKLEELIDKVENVEKKVDAIIEAEVDKSSAAAKVDKPTA